MQNGEIWLDPSASEASVAKGTLSLGYMPALGSVTNIWQRGKLTPDEALKVRRHFNLTGRASHEGSSALRNVSHVVAIFIP